MNEDIILNKNVVDICYESIQLESKKVQCVVKNILQFYSKHILGIKNTYVTIFIGNKLPHLEYYYETNIKIYRKLLVELYLVLSLSKRNTKQTNIKIKKLKMSEDDTEKVLLNEINTYRKMDLILGCVSKLYKTKADLLWRIIESITDHSLYVKSLNNLYHNNEKKDYVLEAYKTLSQEEPYYYNNVDYSNIILQCMLKINYIYEEINKFDKHMEIYVKCLNYPLKGMSHEYPVQYNRLSYIHEEKNKRVNIEPKVQQEYVIFEKVSKIQNV
jgi:hypothetical protein